MFMGIFAASAKAESPKKEKLSVLIDFSEKNAIKKADFPTEKVLKLLKEIKIDTVISDEAQCKEDDFDTPILLGASVAEVNFSSAVKGKQSLVSVTIRSCGQPYWNVDSYLFLVSDEKTISYLKEPCSDIVKLYVPDKNSGVQVGITSCGTSKQGYTETYSKIIGFENGALKVISDFGLVSWDNCGVSVDKVGEERVSVIFLDSEGKKIVKNYKRKCSEKDKKKYKYFSSGQLKEGE
jgi:hypothetical protein